MQIEEILIVRHNGIAFGIPTSWIGQILRIPEMTVLALSPKEIHGICAIGGNITTAVDMNLLLGMEGVQLDSPKSRILALEGKFDTSALVVSEVVESVVIDPENIEYLSGTEDPIIAICHNGEELIQVVDVERLIGAIRPAVFTPKGISEKNGGDTNPQKQESREGRYLLFRMGGEIYGLDIDNLREILGSGHAFTPLSGSDEEVIGMMSLRDELVLIVDLRLYYGFQPRPSEKNRILIAQYGRKVVGLMIDEIIDIKPFSMSQIEPFTESKGKIAGVIPDENHLIALIGEETIEELIRKHDEAIVLSDEGLEEMKDDELFEAVVFRLGGEEYAFGLENVAEIIDMTPVTPIPEAPEMVEGVVNIRGQIVTIGSLEQRLGREPSTHENQKIIICDTAKGRIGFFVDSVSDVMRVQHEEMRPEEEHNGLFSHILYLEKGKRLVLLFDLNRFHTRGDGQ